MKKLLSVIVPIYGVEKYLSKCLDSIIAQTYLNIQIILVNDGSPDKCSQICEVYAARDNRIIVIHKENGGLSSARNAGIEKATGAYIAFVDSDDFIHPKMYEILIDNLERNDADISVSNLKKVYDEREEIDSLGENKVFLYEKRDAMRNFFDKNLYVPTVVAWTKVYKRELFSTIRFPEGKIHEDEFVTYKVFWSAKRIVYTSLKLYYYVQRQGSITNMSINKRFLDVLEAYKEMICFFEHNQERELCLEAVYRYLCLEKEYIKKLKVSSLENKNDLVDRMDNDYHKLYLRNIRSFSLKRRIRLGLYFYLRYSI